MGIDNIIAENAPAHVAEAQRQQRRRQAQPARQQPSGQQSQSGGNRFASLGPVLSTEKSDLMFWLLVADTLLLAYIAWKL